MNKKILFYIFIASLFNISLVFGQTGSGGMVNEIHINNDNGNSVIDRMNEYEIQYRVIKAMSELEELYYDRVWLEIHGGAGINAKFYYSGNLRDMDEFGFLAVKFNLHNPKIYDINRIKALISKIENQLAMKNVEIKPTVMKKVTRISEKIAQYESEKWFRRISIGLMLPVYTVDNNNPEIRAYAFIGYDLQDYLTAHVGFSFTRSMNFYGGVSADFSTPFKSYLNSFGRYLRETFSRSPIYNFTY